MARKASSRMKLDDDSVFGNASEILWSRTSEDIFTDDDYDCTYRVSDSDEGHSYSSWGFSKYEKRSVQKISSYLEAIDDALYEDKFSSLDAELTTECQKWKEAFPYLRLKGVNITPEVDCDSYPDEHEFDAVSSMSSKHGSKSPGIVKHVPSIHDAAEESNGIENRLLNNGLDQVEEIIEKEGIYEENNPCETTRVNSCDELCAFSRGKSPSAFSYYYVKGKIIEYLADIVWKNVASNCSNSTNVVDRKQSEHLPPIVSPQEPLDFPHQKPKVKGWNNLASDFPKLDGVLIVSPKVLLPKNERPGTRATDVNSRPNTGWSSFSESTKDITSPRFSDRRYSRASSKNKLLLDCSDTKVTEKDLELIRMYLPTVEESNPVLQNGLQGLHIQPEVKRYTKLISSDTSNPSAKPPSFLPPIKDNDVNASHYKHPLHESHRRRDVNQNSCMIYARHLNKAGSRPSTSQTEDFNVAGLNRTKRPDSNMSSHARKQSSIPSTAPVGNNLVNIFPIVTPLEPKQLTKRKLTAQRKGVLSAISRDKR